jgi:HSP20 family protein
MFEFSKPGMFNVRYNNQMSLYRPPVDILESDSGILTRIEIAGMNIDDFEINFENNILAINGNRSDPIKNQIFHQMEIHFGEFRIEIIINLPIQLDSISAEYKNGFLEISILKAKTHEIPINHKDSQ